MCNILCSLKHGHGIDDVVSEGGCTRILTTLAKRQQATLCWLRSLLRIVVARVYLVLVRLVFLRLVQHARYCSVLNTKSRRQLCIRELMRGCPLSHMTLSTQVPGRRATRGGAKSHAISPPAGSSKRPVQLLRKFPSSWLSEFLVK